ncbi:hypothetical protein [Pinibacter aurantiacus]|uniref:Lipocalin-like domain-containing protein n=1 Tax=Pinibacter aurantiacus TaxID=2851599 RepID=A0A9E2S7V5_9BACT|nr:hypothetical protein [Pinibacter aurantiacus]MBV4356578.1 hypothetical protein [Pinibacter aurantiacus]
MKNFLLIMAVCVVGFVSCKKDDSSSTSDTDVLVQSAWKIDIIGADIDKNGSIDQDITSQLPSCFVDNSFKFDKGGTGTVTEGATKCNSTDPDSAPFTWTLQNKVLNATIPGFPIPVKDIQMHTLNSTSMELWKDSTLGPVPVTIIVKLKH